MLATISTLAAAECSAKVAFPLSVAKSGHYLTDANGVPYLIQGDAAWSLIAQLRREDVDIYLANRRERGFNAILVSLIEHRFATSAPNNAYGEPPFLSPGDFTRPNEAYFAHVDWVLHRAAEEGFAVLLAPCYAGFAAGNEGWYREMVAAGPERMRLFGEYLGRRYRSIDNIIWVNAGDYNPPDKTLVRAVAEGIRSESPEALQTVHAAPEAASLDYWASEPWLRLNAVYTYAPVHLAMRQQRERPERVPYFLIESAYENEHKATGSRLRMQAYQAMLFGAAGHVFGNNPIWHFDGPGIYRAPTTWKQALNSEGASSMTNLHVLMNTLRWWQMVPDLDGTLLVEGLGPPEARAVAAVAEDSGVAVAYVPTPRDIVINLDRLTGARVRARWYQPLNGRFVGEEWVLNASGKYRFGTETEASSAADEDRLLVLMSQP
jgi:hypothetical protein